MGLGRHLLSTAAAASWLLLTLAVSPACSTASQACQAANHRPDLAGLPLLPGDTNLVHQFTIPALACESNGFTVRVLTDRSVASEVILRRLAASMLNQPKWSRSDRFAPIIEVASPSRQLLVEMITIEDQAELERLDAVYQPRFKYDSVPVRPASLQSPFYLDNTMEGIVRQPVGTRPTGVIVAVHWCGGVVACG